MTFLKFILLLNIHSSFDNPFQMEYKQLKFWKEVFIGVIENYFSNWVWLLFGWFAAMLRWRKPAAGFFLLSYHEQTELSQLQFWAENKTFLLPL